MAPEEDSSVALRLVVGAVYQDHELGRFSLQASQIPAFNAFVPISLLQEKLETPGKANLMLIGGDEFAGKDASQAFLDQAEAAVKKRLLHFRTFLGSSAHSEARFEYSAARLRRARARWRRRGPGGPRRAARRPGGATSASSWWSAR